MSLEVVNGMPAIVVDGEARVLAALPPAPDEVNQFRAYGAIYPTLPADQWRECDYRWYGIKTKNQGQTSSCTGHAGVTAFQYHRAIAGMPPRELSATFVYAHVNGGQDQGASVSSIMSVLQQRGTCPAEMCTLQQLFLPQIQQSAHQAAQDYKLNEAFICRTWQELCSAVTLFGPVSLGIVIGRNFARLNSAGVAPQPDVAVGGHALAGVGLKVINNAWHILLHNSWGSNFGFEGGFCYINEYHTRQMLDGFALIRPRESDRKDDGDEPPVVP